MSNLFLPIANSDYVIIGDEFSAHLNRILDEAIERLSDPQRARDERDALYAELLRQVKETRTYPQSIELKAPTEAEQIGAGK